MLIAEMTKAGTIESDVMLFNIDSKGSAKVGSGKEAIVEVFMKVFNEMQGLCFPQCVEFVWKVGCYQPFFLAFWRRLLRMFLTCAAFSTMVSSVVRSMFSQ